MKWSSGVWKLIAIVRITPDGLGIEPDGIHFFDDRAKAIAFLAKNLTNHSRVYFSLRGENE